MTRDLSLPAILDRALPLRTAITWLARCPAHGRLGGIAARLPNGSVVGFHVEHPCRALYGERWRASHHGRIVGGFEFHAGSGDAFAQWLDRVAREASKRGPETANELGWY